MNMLALLVVRMFFTADVNVKIAAPSKVKQGDEITVSVTISKGSIAGVGHYKQELPAGFGEATVVEAKGAEFKYLPQDNAVKFTWISMPADLEYTVSYKVKVDAAMANGKVNLNGKFSYVLNNEKQTFMVPDWPIMVGEEVLATTTTVTQPETTATPTPIVTQPETTATPTPTVTQPDITASTPTTTTTPPETTTVTTPPVETKTTAVITATRIIVGSPEAGTEFTVEINAKKDGMKGFARIQETLPQGLTALSLDNKGGTFSFIDQKVKIIWDNLPPDEDIKVSYRVVVGDNVSGDVSISGTFSYVENDDPKKIDIPVTTITVKAKTTLALNPTPATTPTVTSTPPETTTAVPSPENKVAYKVQICALSKMQRGTSYFESKFAISDKVSMEFHEGWRKYIVGKYTMYKDARDYRETVRVKGIENPFVTAYNNGKRITVQEALMVSNQQWVR